MGSVRIILIKENIKRDNKVIGNVKECGFQQKKQEAGIHCIGFVLRYVFGFLVYKKQIACENDQR